jgi:hypothetical protein
MGDKFAAQLRPGQQTCRPAANLSVTKKQKQLSAIFSAFWSHWNSQLGNKFVAQLSPEAGS